MSTNNTIRLHELNIPALNTVGYADGLNSAFTTIEANQSILANSDLWKGDRGDSVDIEKVDLTQKPELLAALRTAIKNGTEPSQINGVEWDSLMSTDLYVINKTEVVNGVETPTPISSLYYTFVDGRFVNDSVGQLTESDFGNEVDLSCILVYEDGEFVRLNNIFPTMYFEDGLGLCWMVNGQRTGLPVQGVPGKDGRNSDILIVRVKDNAVDSDGKGIVEESWTKMGGWSTIEDKESIDGYSCFALAPNEDGVTSFYVGKLIFDDDGVLYVICKPELSLQQTFDTQVFVNVMQNISIKSNPDNITTPPGLFVPMRTLGDLSRDENGNVIEDQPVHLMTATSINNEQGNVEDLMTDMVVTPVNTTDLVIDDTHNVKVDKYLYVKMSDELVNFLPTKVGLGVSWLKDVILKYKLSNIVLTKNIQRPYTTDEYVLFQKDNSFNENGQIVMSNIVSYDDHNRLIPTDFESNIDNGIGFFQWELDLTSDTFDPLNTVDDSSTTLGSYLVNIAPCIYTKTMTPGLGDDILWFNGVFVDCDDFYDEYGDMVTNTQTLPENTVVFGYVVDEFEEPIIGATVAIKESANSSSPCYGTTDENGLYAIVLPPNGGATRDFIYNSCHLVVNAVGYDAFEIPIQGRVNINFRHNGTNFDVYTLSQEEDTDQKYKLLRGVDRESLIFNKFIPMYVNDYRMDRDTSYNLNYNVNIMGDEENPKRTLSVFGDINCENINVYELTATGEIKNIYTKNEIVGEDGIDLAKGKFHVDSNGNSTATTVNAGNVISDSVETTTLTSNSLSVRQIDYNINGGISKETENIKVYPIDNDHNIDIDVNNVSSISIVGKIGDKANIDSDIPILLDTNSGIYISTNNELVGYKGNTITGKTGYNGVLEEKVKYYVSACEDTSKGKTTSKYSIKNSMSIYRCKRQTSLDGMTSKFGQTYIQVCNPSGYVVDYTFDGSKNNVSTTPITCDTTIDSTTLSTATSQACCKFSVGDDVKNTSATSFKLKFGKPFVFAVSMNTKCSNSNWAVLKTSNSKVVFKVVVVGTDPDNNSTKIWTPTQFECGFGGGDTEWGGYEQTSKTGNKRWEEFVRTRLFSVQPSDKTFTGNYMGYKNLEVYIVPTISMRFESQDDRKLIDYIGCSQFIPYDRTVSSKDKVYGIDVNTNPDNIVFTNSYVSDTQKQYISLDYEYDIEGVGFRATILDNTGLIYAHNSSAVMGLGYTPKGLGLHFYQKETCGGTPGAYKSIALTDVYDLVETMASSYNL